MCVFVLEINVIYTHNTKLKQNKYIYVSDHPIKVKEKKHFKLFLFYYIILYIEIYSIYECV